MSKLTDLSSEEFIARYNPARDSRDFVMGLPRFRPAALFSNARDFGWSSFAQPVEISTLDPGQRAWALCQHQVALAVSTKLKRKDEDSHLRSIHGLAETLDESPDWLTRKLYGRVPGRPW